MKSHIIIKIHSFIDVITNSSTELFIIDINQGLDIVKKIVDDAIKQFPGEDIPSVHIDNGEIYSSNFFDENEIVTYLRRRGYKIEEPTTQHEPQDIIISWERGSMNPKFIEHIEKTFNTQLIDY